MRHLRWKPRRGKGGPGDRPGTFKGRAKRLHDAIEAAVHFAGKPDGTKFVVGEITVTSKDDPNVGSYSVTITETPPPE